MSARLKAAGITDVQILGPDPRKGNLIARLKGSGKKRPLLLLAHLDDHYSLYGELTGVRSARKHIGWAVRALPGGETFRAKMNLLESCDAQVSAVTDWFDELADAHTLLPAPAAAANTKMATMHTYHINDILREAHLITQIF